MKRQSGFTLIELMVTVAIVALLASIAFPSYMRYVIRANRSAAESQMMDIANRQQQFLLANRRYAGTLAELNFSLSNDVAAKYTCCTDDDASTVDPDIDPTCAANTSGAVPQFTVICTGTGAQAADNDLGSLTLNHAGDKTPPAKWRR